MHTGARRSGKAAFAASGMRPSDMDFASLYDCFTITLLLELELEELGLCPRGEAGRFVEDGHIDRDGSLPTNTNGGLLSGGHPGYPAGLLPVVEAARQMMGEAERGNCPGLTAPSCTAMAAWWRCIAPWCWGARMSDPLTVRCCSACGAVQSYPRPLCTACRSRTSRTGRCRYVARSTA